MTTAEKVLIGAVVVGGGYVAYKLVSGKSTSVANKVTKPGNQDSTVRSFLDFATSLTNYFGKSDPQPQSSWSSSTQWNSDTDFSGQPMGYSSDSVDENALFS